MLAECDELARLLPGRRRVVSVVPAHHIYGFLFTVLLPSTYPGGALPVLDARGSSPPGAVASLEPGDVIVGHPAFWTAWAAGAGPVANDVLATTSTAPCPPDVAATVRAAGFSALLEIYGSTETAGVGWRRAPGAYTLMERWQRADDSHLLRADRDERVALPDRIEWLDPRAFIPAGRRDNLVHVGGHNVSLAAVRERLLDHPLVAEAAVRVTPLEAGGRLKAFIVPVAGAGDIRAELDAWITATFGPPERPRHLRFGEALPRDAAGKLADWEI